LVPLQAIVGLCQPDKDKVDIAARVSVLVIMALLIGTVLYRMGSHSDASFQNPSVGAVHLAVGNVSPQIGNTPARPSFDCARARTRVETLICRDSDLATLEMKMASTYRQVLNAAPPSGRAAVRREHLAWFKNYSR